MIVTNKESVSWSKTKKGEKDEEWRVHRSPTSKSDAAKADQWRDVSFMVRKNTWKAPNATPFALSHPDYCCRPPQRRKKKESQNNHTEQQSTAIRFFPLLLFFALVDICLVNVISTHLFSKRKIYRALSFSSKFRYKVAHLRNL